MAVTASADMIRNIRQSLHDLAQPLAVLAGLVDLLLLEVDENDPKLPEIRLMSEQLEKVLYVIGEIRLMAREASAAEPARREPRAYPKL